MKRILSVRKHPLVLPLTLRWQLTLWTAALFLVLGLGLVVFINSMTAIQIPQVLHVGLVPTVQPSSDHSLPPTPFLENLPPLVEVSDSPAKSMQETIIREVRSISLFGIGAFAVIGAMGAYWIARQALHPVRDLSHLAQTIQAQTLHQRLPAEGPPDELKELADAFNRMLERLERAFEQQSRFVADAAHELRTPLANLRTNLEVVQQDPQASFSDYKEMSAVLERTLSRLEKLVEDLLWLAKGEREIETEPVEMEVLLNEIIQEIEPLARTHQIEVSFHTTEPVIVMADPPLLSRAIGNLLENGIRYNHPGGSVTVGVRYVTTGVEIDVKDTGIGIPLEAQPHIFERFYRVDRSRTRDQGGSGLGLSIAAHIIQLHGGNIRFQSAPGMGTNFTIWLPGIANEMTDDPQS